MNTIETLKAFERNLNKKIKNPIVLKNYKHLIKLIEEDPAPQPSMHRR